MEGLFLPGESDGLDVIDIPSERDQSDREELKSRLRDLIKDTSYYTIALIASTIQLANYHGISDFEVENDYKSYKIRRMMRTIDATMRVGLHRTKDCTQIMLALTFKNNLFIRFLIKYGFRCESGGNPIFRKELVLYLLDSFLSQICNADYEGRPLSWFRRKLTRLFGSIEEMYTGTDSNNLKRIYHVVLVLDVLTCYLASEDVDERASAEYEECLEVYFSAVPDPLVSVTEIKRVLRRISRFVEQSHFLAYYSFDTLLETFVAIKPSCVTKKHQPRSLSHLVRCKIRQCMPRIFFMQHYVDQLNLPKTLKNFILCDP